jgi:hypothetical protein
MRRLALRVTIVALVSFTVTPPLVAYAEPAFNQPQKFRVINTRYSNGRVNIHTKSAAHVLSLNV